MKNYPYEDQRFLSIDLTNRCTHNCIFCVVKDRNAQIEDLNIKNVKIFLEEYKAKGFTEVNLHGGEPTEYPKIEELICMINELGYTEITIQTNGNHLENKKFVKFLIEHKVRLFVVSMHDCIPDLHNSVTGNRKSFEVAVEGIANVLKHGGMVRTNTVLIKSNYRRIVDIIDYLYGLGVKMFNLSSLNPTWASNRRNKELFEMLAPTYIEQAIYVEQLLKKYTNKDVKITLEGFPYCFLPTYNAYNLYNHFREIIMLSYPYGSVCNYEENLDKYKVRMKAKMCTTCDKNNICKGVWTGYTQNMGWKEFYPLSNIK